MPCGHLHQDHLGLVGAWGFPNKLLPRLGTTDVGQRICRCGLRARDTSIMGILLEMHMTSGGGASFRVRRTYGPEAGRVGFEPGEIPCWLLSKFTLPEDRLRT